jgi:hypothetical protein
MPRLPKMLICRACDHRFDPRDERARVFPNSPDLDACPACNAIENQGREAWAVWNSCNGVFSCSVAETKEAATERLNAGGFDPSSESVIPVVIVYGKPFIVEPSWRHR